jgi:prepilin-type N-terminal cleavage/methylation domain-containing protein
MISNSRMIIDDARGATTRRSGMTLMELVIGLAITGMMAAAGAGAFSSIIDHRREIRDASRSTERAEAFREMLRSWVYAGNIQLQRGGGPRGIRITAPRAEGLSPSTSMTGSLSSVTAAQAAGDEFSFTTTAPNPAMVGSVRMRMYVDADGSTPETGLTVEYQPNAQQPLMRRMLDSTIDSLIVDYLDSRTGRWYRSSETATISPIAVRLSFHSTDSTESALMGLPMLFPIGNPSSPNLRGARR